MSGDRTVLLERFASGYGAVEAAVADLPEPDLERRAAPDEWSVREIVHHLADSEAVAYVRLRRLIAEDEPRIEGYDEPEYARRLHYDRPIGPSLAVLRAVREASLGLLHSLGEAEWGRAGTHSESGRYGVEDWLRIYAGHSHDHAAQIRAALGEVAP